MSSTPLVNVTVAAVPSTSEMASAASPAQIVGSSNPRTVSFRALLAASASAAVVAPFATVHSRIAVAGRVGGLATVARPRACEGTGVVGGGALASGHPTAPVEDNPLDPIHRRRDALMHLSSVLFREPAPGAWMGTASTEGQSQARAATSLEDLFPALVRRIAWSGDGRRGTARIEIGSGELAGAVLLVHTEGESVRVRLDVPAGVNQSAWQHRIARSLSARGISADALEVQ